MMGPMAGLFTDNDRVFATIKRHLKCHFLHSGKRLLLWEVVFIITKDYYPIIINK